MSGNSNDWKEMLGLAAMFLALCLGLATCQYVEHRIDTEKHLMKTSK